MLDGGVLYNISVINNGVPQLLNSNTSGFSFPYQVENSAILLPNSLIVDLNAFFGNSDLSLLPTPDAICLEIPGGAIGPNIVGEVSLPSKLLKMN